MKLYNLYRGKYFTLDNPLDVKVPPDAPEALDQVYKLGSIEGMYSWSIGQIDGERYYFAAWTEVTEVTP